MIDPSEWPEFEHPHGVVLTADQYNLARKCVLEREEMVELLQEFLEELNEADSPLYLRFRNELNKLKGDL